MITASIDMGTNTIRLLIAENIIDKCRFMFLHQESRMARIGEGFGKTKTIKNAALQRTIKILTDYKRTIDKFGVEHVFITATSAIREADNKEWFLSRLFDIGFEIETISAEKEAYLTHAGIVYSIKDLIKNKKWTAFDLGGGSTEFMFSNGEKLTYSTSIPLGVVKLVEMFVENDPPTQEEIKAIKEYFLIKLKKIDFYSNDMDILVGNAGTVTSLAAMDLKLQKYDKNRVEGHILSKERIKQLFEKLLSVNSKTRLNKYKILEKGREDVIVVGVAVVETIMDFFNQNRLLSTNGSLREGILIERLCK